MRSFRFFTLMLLLAGLAAIAFAAQAPKPANNAPKYDVATETTVKGVIQDVKSYQCPISGTVGTHLILKTSDGQEIEIHLGATKYMTDYSFLFKPGEQVTVVGSKVKFEGKDVIIARTLDREDMFMTFRDKNGKPLW